MCSFHKLQHPSKTRNKTCESPNDLSEYLNENMSTIGAIKRKKGILEGEQNKDLEALKKIERLKKETEMRVKEREMLLIEIERQSIDVAPDSTINKHTQERKEETITATVYTR